jgi:predicted ferric reductase
MTDLPLGSRNRSIQAALICIYALLVAAPSTLLLLYNAGGYPLSRIGDLLILAVFPILALQPVLSARLRVLDRSFGLDAVYIFHKIMGMTAGAALLCAVVFRAAGRAYSRIFPGIAAAVLLSVVVLTAFLFHELRMSYEAWRKLHNVLTLASLAAVFALALFAAPVAGNWPMLALLVLYFAGGTAAYVQHRIVGPIKRQKNLYRIERVERETHNVWNLTIKPPDGLERFDFLPGQFQFLTFDNGRGEEHPFTISSSPTLPGMHTATIKESGDFTRRLNRISAGDLLAVQAPFGRFSYLLHPDEKDIVFIAGGIGITPIMSMLRHMRDSAADKDVQLLYANNSEEDIVFRRELEELASGKAPRLRVTHVLARPGEGWLGERGYIDWTMIEKSVSGNIRAKSFYVCGPPPMMNALIAILIENGVPSRQVRSERFSL